jgi:hypothetical protein
MGGLSFVRPFGGSRTLNQSRDPVNFVEIRTKAVDSRQFGLQPKPLLAQCSVIAVFIAECIAEERPQSVNNFATPVIELLDELFDATHGISQTAFVGHCQLGHET